MIGERHFNRTLLPSFYRTHPQYQIKAATVIALSLIFESGPQKPTEQSHNKLKAAAATYRRQQQLTTPIHYSYSLLSTTMMMLTGRHSNRILTRTGHCRVIAPSDASSARSIMASVTTGRAFAPIRPQVKHSYRYFSTTLKNEPPLNMSSSGNSSTQNNMSRTLATAVPLDATAHTANDYANPNPPPDNNFNFNPLPDFNDAKAAYERMTTTQLMRAVLSFGLCQVPILVSNAEGMLQFSRKVVGDTITDGVLKQTMFGHFCAGEDEKRIMPAILNLQKAGIGSILDFAAEDDGSDADDPNKDANKSKASVIADEIIEEEVPIARLYDYESEAKCDRHVETFTQCIKSVKTLGPDGYAAIKVTALGNPRLLERMSLAILEAQNLFAKFDRNGDGTIGREEFEEAFQMFFNNCDDKLKRMIAATNPDESGDVDYITWSMLLQPRDLPRIIKGCKEHGPLSMAAPTEEELVLIEAMYARGHALAQEAAACGTRLLIDAEQARFQPVIDSLVLELQRTYNAKSVSDKPIIYNTYQCYLKDVPERLAMDVERSERSDYHFGAKLVRGAYMESERALAETLGSPCPIHDTIEDTHKCYNDSVDFLLEHAVKSDKQVELMVATHNQESIEMAIASMNRHGIDRKGPTISFGQLYGMSDNLTFNLGKHGYRAYKYGPYGEVKMVVSQRTVQYCALHCSAVHDLC
jgi:proline dehydrogenase